MSDTPETDDLARGNHVVPTEWAEQLERERDEARKYIERQRLEIVRLNGATNHAGGTPLKIALRERDEAREELQKLEGAYEDATNYYARMIELREELDQVKEELKNKTYDKLKS